MKKPGSKKHTFIYLSLALLMTIIAIGGFWNTYWWPVLTGSKEFHWLLHIHGAVFTIWMGLLILQAGLVYQNKVGLHQLIGKRMGIMWGILIILLGVSLGFGRISPGLGKEYETLQAFIWDLPIPLGDLLVFAILFGCGIYYRKKPETHKRLMILSTAALLWAPAGRLVSYFDSFIVSISIGLLIPLVPAVIAITHDWWRRNKIHPAYKWGTSLIALRSVSFLFIFSPIWKETSADIAENLSSILQPLL